MTPPIKWKDAWNTGVPSIDKQHKELVDLVNKLSEQEPEKAHELLPFLIEYAADHFMDEEELMSKINYADIEQHKLEHKLFTSALLDFSVNILSGSNRAKAKENLTDFVVKWFVYHFLKSDKKLAKATQEVNDGKQ